MQTFAKLAKTAGARATSAGVAGTVAAATLAQPTAHAYELQAGPSSSSRSSRFSESWELTDLKDAEHVIFRSEEIDEAAGRLCRTERGSTFITEIDSEGSTSDGEHADEAIELAGGHEGGLAAQAALPAVLQVATRLLKQPGVQREVCRAMVEDAEIMDILERELGRDNLESYLAHTGFATQGLLTAGDDDTTATAAAPTAAPAAQSDPLLHLALGMARGLEAAGEGMARLGGWIRLRLMGPAVDGVGGGNASAKRARRGARAQRFFGSVFVVMVAVVVTVVLRRPTALRQVVRLFARR